MQTTGHGRSRTGSEAIKTNTKRRVKAPTGARGRGPDYQDHNPFDNPELTAKHRRERQLTESEHRHADVHRLNCTVAHARDQSAAVDDAMADLRKVMATNADVLDSSKILAHIARFADARHAERYATVFGVAMRAVLAIPPQVVLPPIIGGEVSLNLLLAVVGDSGGGKGSADKTAAAAVCLSAGGHRPLAALPMMPLGTGEGINRTYARAERDVSGNGQVALRWHTDRALFGCRDIASIDALMSRKGSTLVPELLKAYMGEELGFANAERERRVILPMHSYRLCLSAGVQPDNGVVLLNDQARRDGVPQRFLWTPVRPGVARPRRSSNEGAVEPLSVAVPTFGVDPFTVAPLSAADDDCDAYDHAARPLVPIEVASPITQTIIDADATKDLDPFGRCDDPLAGHRLLAQLKLAAALAVLHNRTDVGDEDWQRAEQLIEVSTAVVRVVAAESASAAERDAVRRGQIDGHRLAAADDARQTAKFQTVTERILRYLAQQTGWTSHSALRRSLTSTHRPHFDDAVVSLLSARTIQHRKSQRAGQDVIEYRMTPS